VGADIAAMIEHLENGSARLAFSNDLEIVQKYGVRGFPTFLFHYDGKEMLLRGFQSYSSMRAALGSLTDNRLQEHPPEKTQEAILNFLQVSGRAAPIELGTIFDLSTAELELMLINLKSQQRIRQVPAGNGSFWESVATGASCDPVSGICTV